MDPVHRSPPPDDPAARARGRGRPRDASKHASIVLAAQVLFISHGYAATSMEAIAEQAGVSKLTVYNQFGSKQDIFVAAVKAKCAEMLSSLDLATTGRMPPRRALVSVGHAFLGLIMSAEAVAMFRLIVQERSPELSGLFYRSAIVPTIEQVAAVIAAFEAGDTLSFGDPMQAAHDYLDLLKGHPWLLTMMGLPPMSPAELDRHVEHCADVMLRAWTSRPAPAAGVRAPRTLTLPRAAKRA
ncbi:MAG: TetR/AcrR family transcriptional regulator [bacterium]|nr:TetR/AcrR family transcriptional regulator [Betaproteobacteria bacterium]